jgi:hypothetical protein
MPLREPRMEMDRVYINELLELDGFTIASIYKFVHSINIGSYRKIGEYYVFNRGEASVEDTCRRLRDCVMISIWTGDFRNERESDCVFQQPIPIKMKLDL